MGETKGRIDGPQVRSVHIYGIFFAADSIVYVAASTLGESYVHLRKTSTFSARRSANGGLNTTSPLPTSQ